MGVLVVAHVALVACAFPLTAIDWREHRLPDRYTLSLWAGSALVSLGAPAQASGGVIGSALVVLVLWLCAEAPGQPLGFGDVKLGGALGMQLGWYGVETAMAGVVLAVMAGGIYSLWLLLWRRIRASEHIAFGPWLFVGALGVLSRV